MNEYLMLGLVAAISMTAAFGVSWISKAVSGSKNKDKDKA